MLKLAPFREAFTRSGAWYNVEEHTIYIGFAPERYILEILSHEALHQTIREMFDSLSNFAHRASRGIDVLIEKHGYILRRGGL